jgi:hypothetical protein
MTSIQNTISPSANCKRAAGVMGMAAVVLAGFGFASAAEARDNVQFSVQIGSPGYAPAPVYAYPTYPPPQVVYVQPRPIYVQPRPVYVQPAPVYYQGPPVYIAPQVTYGYPSGYPHRYRNGHGNGRGHGNNEWRQHGNGQYVQPQQGYGQVYYQR